MRLRWSPSWMEPNSTWSPVGPAAGYFLTSDAEGNGTWQPGGVPDGLSILGDSAVAPTSYVYTGLTVPTSLGTKYLHRRF